MRKPILFLCLVCLNFISRAGMNDDTRNNDPKRWKTGFVVTLTGDTISGRIKTTDFLDVYYDYQRIVTFKDQKGSASQYSPAELSSFSYNDEKDMITMQSVSSPDGDGLIFLRLYYAGSCKVYGMTASEVKWENDMGPGNGQIHSSLIPTERKFIQIGGSQFYLLKRVNFKKNMREIFASCPHILSGLDARVYTYDNLQALVSDYNSGRR